MLTEERYAKILHILKEKQAVTVLDLTRLLDASESTVRRDLTALHKSGHLNKVHGGATAIDSSLLSSGEDDMRTKSDLHTEEKLIIGRRAASLIQEEDFVYLDAGSTTFSMIEFIPPVKAVFVTNGLPHAARLAGRGLKVFILGGKIKATTEAVIGTEALHSLQTYNFTKGFFGTNGISLKSGYSTPDPSEGIVKGEALSRSKNAFILADSSKFNRISPTSFADLSAASIITEQLPDMKYHKYTTILEGEAN